MLCVSMQTKVDNIFFYAQVGQETSDKRTMHACHEHTVEQN
jgi:hypothetical protein